VDKIYVAKIGKTVGLKGLQKLHIDSDFPEQFKKDSKFYTDRNQELIIESYNSKNDTVKFVGIDSIEDAKKLTNRQLYTTSEQTKQSCTLKDKQYFWFDIVECKVIEDDETLGIVSDIQRLPISDYLYIKTDKELVDKGLANSFLVPYLDDFIVSVDIENKTLILKNAKDILDAS